MRRLPASAAALTLTALVLIGCSGDPGPGEPVDPPNSAEPVTTPEPSATADPLEQDPLDAELERFYEEQGVLDGVVSSDLTGPQQELVAAHRELWEEEGLEWDGAAEHITITLALDGCESAIRNHHEIDSRGLREHVEGSAVFEALLAEVPAQAYEDTEGRLVHSMVFGMDYLCPDDFNDWVRAGAGLYPDYFSE